MARTRLPVFALACIALLVSAMGQQQQQPGGASNQQMAQPSSGAGGANNNQASSSGGGASSSDMQAVQPDQGVLNFAAQQVCHRVGALHLPRSRRHVGLWARPMWR